jgi:hypothetical protein
VYDRKQLERVGRSAASCIQDRPRWLHRRVESVTFPLPTDRVYRRRLSIDFTIPDGLDPVHEDGGDRYYVPLSLLRRWPPLLRLSIRSGSDLPIPLLTLDQNAIIDYAFLTEYAQIVARKANLKLDNYSRGALRTLAGVRESPYQPRPTRDVLAGALVSLIPPPTFGKLSPARNILRQDELFVEIAGGLRDHTLLWLRVDGRPGDREIVKLTYDEPFTARVPPHSREALGLAPFQVRFQAPHIGGSGSYHLVVSVPDPLLVADAAVIIRQPGTAEGKPQQREIVAVCTPIERETQQAVANGLLYLYTATAARDVRFYVAGPRTGCEGEVGIALLVQRSGLIRPGAMASIAIAALLTFLTLRLGAVVKESAAVVPVLLGVPALLIYLVVRPGDHAVVGQFVSGVRRFLLTLGGLPIVAATGIVASHSRWYLSLKLGFAFITCIAFGISAILVVAWRAPRRGRNLPFSHRNTERPIIDASSVTPGPRDQRQ